MSDATRKVPVGTGADTVIVAPSNEASLATARSTMISVVKPGPRALSTQGDVRPPRVESTGIDMRYLVRALVKYGASDLHIKADRPPLYRINGKLVPSQMEELSAEKVARIIYGVLGDKQIRELEDKLSIDFSFRYPDIGRFRCNVFHQRGSLAAVIRMIPMVIPRLEDLGVPSVLKEICQRKRGLVLVTGATGAGKSTTLAAMLNYINVHRPVHILSIEDPIEFVHRDQKASISQRELGTDVHSMEGALENALREDPDIIVVGELRSMKAIQIALTAAETGHLVMSTLHTNSAKSTLDRIIDVFPAESKNQVRIQLASTLVAVVSQQLLLRGDGKGRVPACEVMINSPTIESFIFKNELDRIDDAIEQSNNYYRMQSLNQDLERLVRSGQVSVEEALKASYNPDNLKLRFSGITREEGFGS